MPGSNLLHDVFCNHCGDARHVTIGQQLVAIHVQLPLLQTLHSQAHK